MEKSTKVEPPYQTQKPALAPEAVSYALYTVLFSVAVEPLLLRMQSSKVEQ